MNYKNVYKYDEMKRTEHMAVRKTAGWYLWTHQLLEVTGKDAATFLDNIFANPIANLKTGSERYTTMLNEQAEIIDDVVVFRMEDQKFWISTLFMPQLVPWLEKHKGDYKVEFKDITKQYHMYAVQGPKSLELVNALVAKKADDQKFFTIRDNTIDGVPVKINRAGFTGEKLGYEVYIPADKCDFLEAKLREQGKPLGAVEVTEFQIMAWTLPTEAGYYYMRDLGHTNPLEAGLERGIDWNKDFIGKEALLKIKQEGPAREMVGFVIEEADARLNPKNLGGPGNAVILNGEEVGRVSKFVYSFVQEKNVGYILAKRGVLKPGDHVRIRNYDAVITAKSFL
ncbi:MAG: aminomethyltransferase family protein [Treponema sp.]|jgi:aminomethyltransferase|nr:aminomethyltransferase family protein [Treponema sp.]